MAKIKSNYFNLKKGDLTLELLKEGLMLLCDGSFISNDCYENLSEEEMGITLFGTEWDKLMEKYEYPLDSINDIVQTILNANYEADRDYYLSWVNDLVETDNDLIVFTAVTYEE